MKKLSTTNRKQRNRRVNRLLINVGTRRVRADVVF
jgi:hypothetical protein